MKLATAVVVLSLAALAPSARASFPGRDGELLHADLFTDKQMSYATYLRTRSLVSGNGQEWFPCSTDMGFRCSATLAPGVGDVRYSPDGQRIAVGLTGFGFNARPPAIGLATMAATSTNSFAVDAKFVEIAGLAGLAWSPDGSELVAEQSGSLVRLKPDGTQLGVLEPEGRAPDWSRPDRLRARAL